MSGIALLLKIGGRGDEEGGGGDGEGGLLLLSSLKGVHFGLHLKVHLGLFWDLSGESTFSTYQRKPNNSLPLLLSLN